MRVFFCDLDGTLWQQQGDQYQVDPADLEAVRHLMARGIRFVPATGRGPEVLHRLQSWLGTEVRDVIASNGSRIFRAGELIGCEGVGGETAFQLYQALSCSGCAMMLETASHGRLVIGQQESGTSLWSQAYHLKTADLLRRLPSLKICKITVIIQNDIQQRQVSAIANRFSSLRWLVNQLGNVEFLPDGVSKATAIRYYCQSEGIRREETAFIGDEINDIEAMEEAGLSFCMRHARPEVCRHADFAVASVRQAIELTLRK